MYETRNQLCGRRSRRRIGHARVQEANKLAKFFYKNRQNLDVRQNRCPLFVWNCYHLPRDVSNSDFENTLTKQRSKTGTSRMSNPSTRNRGANSRHRTRAAPSTTRTRTVTVTPSQQGPGRAGTGGNAPVLRLKRRRRVRWTSDTHNNEHDGKKSSKSCCIYHRTRNWDESETESECSEEEVTRGPDAAGGASSEKDGRDKNEDGDGGGADGENDSSSSGGPARKPLGKRRAPEVPDDDDDGFFD